MTGTAPNFACVPFSAQKPRLEPTALLRVSAFHIPTFKASLTLVNTHARYGHIFHNAHDRAIFQSESYRWSPPIHRTAGASCGDMHDLMWNISFYSLGMANLAAPRLCFLAPDSARWHIKFRFILVATFWRLSFFCHRHNCSMSPLPGKNMPSCGHEIHRNPNRGNKEPR